MKQLEELAVHCIRCGFCLEDCPTFQVTGSELESPRGRIYLARSAEAGKIDWQDVQPHFDRCLGCLACETSCPSGVHYGQILELAREQINAKKPNHKLKNLIHLTTSPGPFKAAISLGKVLPKGKLPKFLDVSEDGSPSQAELPHIQSNKLPPLKDRDLPAVLGEVYFLEGCAMRVLYPRVHEASKRLLRRVGYTVKTVQQGCCGSMDAHNGYLSEARAKADALIASMPGSSPVIVNSAGCGSTMTHYQDLLGPRGKEFAARCVDISTFLRKQGLEAVLASSKGVDFKPTTYHDACHLAHGQKSKEDPRALIRAVPDIQYLELPESDTCCGSAGVYNFTQPKLSKDLLDRKVDHIEDSHAEIIVLGNPGCHAWIAQGVRQRHKDRIQVLHIAEFLEASFIGLQEFL